MTEMAPFEERLATRLRAYAATAARPPSPEAVARAVDAARDAHMVRTPRLRRPAGQRESGLWLPVAVLLALLLIAALVSVLAAGGWLRLMADVRPTPGATATFQAVGVLPSGTRPQAIVAAADGSALLIGLEGPLGSIFRFEPASGSFARVGSLQIPRIQPATVGLPDGRLLIVGGGHDIEQPPPAGGYRAEIFDPASSVSTLTGSTVQPRAWGTASLLADGRVLVAGGAAQGVAVATAELFDPRTGTFVETGSMSRPRSDHAAILLDDGHVLIVGGAGSGGPPSAELFDPKTGTFARTGPMVVPQATDFSATRLDDGRVLIVGGWSDQGTFVAAAQMYDPDTGRFTQTGSLPGPRQHHSAALLDDGRVLIVGGWDGGEDATAEGDDALIYDPIAGTFAPAPSLSVQRLAPFVVTLTDGRVLVVGSQCWSNGCYGLDALPGAVDRGISAEVFE